MKFEIMPTEHAQDAAAVLRTDLGELADQNASPVFIRRSAGDLPQFIYIIGTAIGGLAVLGTGAFFSQFFGRLGTAAAESVLGAFKADEKKELPENLVHFSNAVAKTCTQNRGQFQVWFRLALESGVEVDLQLSEAAEHIEFEIAVFTAVVDEVSAFFANKRAGGDLVISATAQIKPTGEVSLRWFDSNAEHYETFRVPSSQDPN